MANINKLEYSCSSLDGVAGVEASASAKKCNVIMVIIYGIVRICKVLNDFSGISENSRAFMSAILE